MQQTPLHHVPNMDLLNVMPKASRVVEAGASSGALAQAYKRQHPECHYVGIEIDPEFASIAGQHCVHVLLAELDALTDIVLNAPPTKLVDEPMAEHLLRKLMQLQREKLFTSPE